MISILVPVYNLADRLPRCLDSLCAQTYGDFEIIIIDDGSLDRSAEIAMEYAKKDSRIKFIHKENGGVSSARNRGLDEAVGDFVVFVDGDDICTPKMLEKLLIPMKNANVIFSRCAYSKIFDCDQLVGTENKGTMVTASGLYCERILSGGVEIGACGALFRSSLIQGLRFETGLRHNEDKLFLFDYLSLNRGSVVDSSDVMYGYVQHVSSATHSGYRPAVLDVIKANELILEHTRQRLSEITALAETNLQIARLSVLKNIVDSGCVKKEKSTFQEIKNSLSKTSAKMPLRYRLEMGTLRIGDWLYIICVKIYRIVFGIRIRKK